MPQAKEINLDKRIDCKFCADKIEGDAECCEVCKIELKEEYKEFKALNDLIDGLSEKLKIK